MRGRLQVCLWAPDSLYALPFCCASLGDVGFTVCLGGLGTTRLPQFQVKQVAASCIALGARGAARDFEKQARCSAPPSVSPCSSLSDICDEAFPTWPSSGLFRLQPESLLRFQMRHRRNLQVGLCYILGYGGQTPRLPALASDANSDHLPPLPTGFILHRCLLPLINEAFFCKWLPGGTHSTICSKVMALPTSWRLLGIMGCA